MAILRPGRLPTYLVLGGFLATSIVLVAQPVATGAGNTSAPVQYTFRVDTLAPTATPKSPAAGATAVSQTGNVTTSASR